MSTNSYDRKLIVWGMAEIIIAFLFGLVLGYIIWGGICERPGMPYINFNDLVVGGGSPSSNPGGNNHGRDNSLHPDSRRVWAGSRNNGLREEDLQRCDCLPKRNTIRDSSQDRRGLVYLRGSLGREI